MKFVPLGDCDDIGASCHFIRLGETGLLLDTGADPDKEGQDSLPDLHLIHERADWWVDHAIVSHAHNDHLGTLPVVIREFPHVHVHMTPATRSLADILLPASARLQRRRVREGTTLADPLFEEEECEVLSHLYMTHAPGFDFNLSGLRHGGPISGQFYDAGHVLGSAGVLIRWTEEGAPRTLFFTGDTGAGTQTIIPGAVYPEEPVDILVLESTLGSDPYAEQVTRRSEEKRLGESLARALARKGTVLMPVFALGRSQEMLALIDRYKKRGIIDEDTPVYTAGQMRAISDIYDRTRFTTPRLNEEFQVFGVPQKRLPRKQNGLNEALNRPGIFLVGSGMMFEKTISNKIAQHLVASEKNAIFLVGYAKEDSPAHKLVEAAAEGPGAEAELDRFVGKQKIECEVDRFRFSGHSDRRELLQLVDLLQPKDVILVHGEAPARKWMAENIVYFHPEIRVHLPERGKVLEL